MRQDPHELFKGLVNHEVQITLVSGRKRIGEVIGCGPGGFQITSGIGGRMLFDYGEVDAVSDLGLSQEPPMCICPDVDVTPPGGLPGSETVKGYEADCAVHGRASSEGQTP
jgi:hypothetical protein